MENSADFGGIGGRKPDAGIVKKEFVDLNDVPSAKSKSGKNSARANFLNTSIIIEVKQHDPYCDPQSEPGTPEYKKHSLFVESQEQALGQITAYDALILAQQYRTCCFSILVVGTRARIRRTDRAGTIVTRAMDLDTEEGAKHFGEFLWRFCHASLEEQGFDLAHAQASDEEDLAFKDVISENISLQFNKGQEEVSALLKRHYKKGCVSKMNVYGKIRRGEGQSEIQAGNANGIYREPIQVLVSIPIKVPESCCGRGTRVYWVAFWDSEAGVWSCAVLKDCWRSNASSIEGAAYQKLLDEGNQQHPNIPTLLAHSDMIVQEGDGSAIEDDEVRKMWEWEKMCNKCENDVYSFHSCI